MSILFVLFFVLNFLISYSLSTALYHLFYMYSIYKTQSNNNINMYTSFFHFFLQIIYINTMIIENWRRFGGEKVTKQMFQDNFYHLPNFHLPYMNVYLSKRLPNPAEKFQTGKKMKSRFLLGFCEDWFSLFF